VKPADSDGNKEDIPGMTPVKRTATPHSSSAPQSLPRISHRFEQATRQLLNLLVPNRFKNASPIIGEHAEIIAAIPPSVLQAEIESLPIEQTLVSSGKFRVLYASASQIPWCLQELGRLREISFRAAGEGTGRASDIDVFDAHYLHLFVWDSRAQAVVGAYRMGLTDEILARYGKQGLYTHSLFKYTARVLQSLNPAIELGRSFVRAEYQRSYSALMLLWSGIAHFVQRHPRYAILFGAVSISNSYDPVSRQVILEYLKANTVEIELARHIKARQRFPRRKTLAIGAGEMAGLKDIDDLSRLVARIEPDAKGVPVLLRQYLKLGGRLLGFSADAQFSNTLDGLIKVDLRNSDLKALGRYMSADGLAAFLAYHSAEPVLMRRAS
jgi:GNAT acetyltransferase-like protein